MKKLKLSNLEKQTLNQKEMNLITGGETTYCGCSCYYAGSGGGSSIKSNSNANAAGGLWSETGKIQEITVNLPAITVIGYV